MRALPPLREALALGKLTFTKTLLFFAGLHGFAVGGASSGRPDRPARDASAADVEARIDAAAETTWQQTERESTAEEEPWTEQPESVVCGVRRR